MDSPIFIVGCPRSGTSLLRNLLRSHPNLSFPPESHFIPLYYKAYGDPKNEREARSLAAKILSLRWIKYWRLPLTPNLFMHDRSYVAIISRLFRAWAHKEGKSRWGDKTPQYVAQIPTLIELFPYCKIIHIYRDGRDVVLSWLRTQHGPRNIYSASHAWKFFVTKGRTDGAALPSKTYFEVRYETLLHDPEKTMKRICGFIEEPFNDAILTPTVAARTGDFYPPARIGGSSRKRPSFKQIEQRNFDLWKKGMPARDQILFESISGDTLRALGYETIGRVRRINQLEQIYWFAHDKMGRLFNRINTKSFFQMLMDFLKLMRAEMLWRYRIIRITYAARLKSSSK